MKKTIATAAIALSLSAAFATAPAQAEEAGPAALTGLGGGALAGGLVAGPVGVIPGALFGLFIGHGEDLESKLARTEQRLQQTQAALDRGLERLADWKRNVKPASAPAPRTVVKTPLSTLAFPVQFRTGSHALEPHLTGHLQHLASAFSRVPGVTVRLTGHADRRGSDDANKALSRQRVESVKAVLVKNGVPAGAIHLEARGESAPLSQEGDLEGYGFDRRVGVQFVIDAPVHGERGA